MSAFIGINKVYSSVNKIRQDITLTYTVYTLQETAYINTSYFAKRSHKQKDLTVRTHTWTLSVSKILDLTISLILSWFPFLKTDEC